MRTLRTLAALAALLAARPAAAQTVIPGFQRSDQSDVSGVSLTSADMLGFEPGTIKSFSCPVAWGVRTTSDALRGELAGGAGSGGGAAGGASPDLLALLDDGPDARAAGERLVASLSADNSGEARRAARGLVPRLRGLLASASRMNPAAPGELAATRLNASVTQFNRFVDASSPEFLAAPPREMTDLRDVLLRLVEAAAENEGRVTYASWPRAAGVLACAPPAVAPPLPPPPLPPLPPPPAEVRMCVVHEGAVREVSAVRDPATGAVTVNGQPFSAAFPDVGQYAESHEFFTADRPVTFGGRRYVRFGLPRVLEPSMVRRAGEFMGVPVFVEAGAAGGTQPVIYLPVRTGCEFQPYELEVKAGSVRGCRPGSRRTKGRGGAPRRPSSCVGGAEKHPGSRGGAEGAKNWGSRGGNGVRGGITGPCVGSGSSARFFRFSTCPTGGSRTVPGERRIQVFPASVGASRPAKRAGPRHAFCKDFCRARPRTGGEG